MSRYNWWRESRLKPKLKRSEALKGRPFLLQQIEHGDYDLAPYLSDARKVMKRCEQEIIKTKETWKAGPDSLRDKIDEIERKHIKRYNKLMEDFYITELRTLTDLKLRLCVEFGVDVWDNAINSCKGDLKDLYFTYQELTEQAIKTIKMGRYRKKPVEIEAVQFISQNIQEVYEMLGDNLLVVPTEDGEGLYHYIKTLEGDMEISWNDYVIKGVKGEFYPCKPDIFELTYDKIN